MSIKTAGKNATANQNRYIANKYDRIMLLVPKGEKERIAEEAKKRGESTNAFIVASIYNRIENKTEE